MDNITSSNNLSVNVHEVHGIPQLTWTSILTGIVLYTIVLVTIFGNILVLVAFYVNKNLQTTFNYYVVNLAITDFAVALTAMSFHTTDNILGYWPFGGFLCGVWIFFDYGMTFVSVFTLILISVDRFWSVTWSVHYRRYHSKKKSIIAIMFMWLFMLALWLPPCIYDRLHNAKAGECIWEPSLNKGFVVVVAIIGHHGSCIVMMFCYLKVFLFMRKHRRIMASQDAKRVPNSQVSVLDYSNDNASSNYIQSGHTAMLNTSVFEATDGPQTQAETSHEKFSQEYQNKTSVRQDALEVPILYKRYDGKNTIPRIKTERLRRQKRERAIFVTLTYVVIGYAICWVPFHVVFDISALCPSCVPRGVYAVTFWMTYINSTINPFLYNFSTPEFRRTFRRLLCRHYHNLHL